MAVVCIVFLFFAPIPHAALQPLAVAFGKCNMKRLIGDDESRAIDLTRTRARVQGIARSESDPQFSYSLPGKITCCRKTSSTKFSALPGDKMCYIAAGEGLKIRLR